MASLGIDIGGTSVKACLLDGKHALHARSDSYSNPTRQELASSIGQAVGQFSKTADLAVGLCLPGKRSADGQSIEHSVNLPCLDGWGFDELLSDAMGSRPQAFTVMSDVQAAGEDFICAHSCGGRTAAIAIGTGVGLAVFDDGVAEGIGGRGVGHLGMMDMGRLGEHDVVAPDGSKNTVESYVGVRAIERRFPDRAPDELPLAIASLAMEEPIMTAIVRMIRVVHAIYVPDQIVLLGGVGISLWARSTELKAVVNDGLTSLANPDWELMFGACAFHAACGAARSVS